VITTSSCTSRPTGATSRPPTRTGAPGAQTGPRRGAGGPGRAGPARSGWLARRGRREAEPAHERPEEAVGQEGGPVAPSPRRPARGEGGVDVAEAAAGDEQGVHGGGPRGPCGPGTRVGRNGSMRYAAYRRDPFAGRASRRAHGPPGSARTGPWASPLQDRLHPSRWPPSRSRASAGGSWVPPRPPACPPRRAWPQARRRSGTRWSARGAGSPPEP
jgi:hypothetical protein